MSNSVGTILDLLDAVENAIAEEGMSDALIDKATDLRRSFLRELLSGSEEKQQ